MAEAPTTTITTTTEEVRTAEADARRTTYMALSCMTHPWSLLDTKGAAQQCARQCVILPPLSAGGSITNNNNNGK